MDIYSLVSEAKERKASDLHITADNPPMVRVRGSIERLNGDTPLSASDMKDFLEQMTAPKDRESFCRDKELDFGYTVPGVTRLRGNAAIHRGNISIAMRLIASEIPTVEDLKLPDTCKKLIMRPRGLVMVSGAPYRQRQVHNTSGDDRLSKPQRKPPYRNH